MIRTYTFLFNPEPEGGYTVTCPALPGLVTYGETLQQAREMARDAMEGLIEVMIEQGEQIPESDTQEVLDFAIRDIVQIAYSAKLRPGGKLHRAFL